MDEEISICPVAATAIGPIPAMGIVIVRFDFLTHPSQPIEQPHLGRNYALTPVQARDLVERVRAALGALESVAPGGPPEAPN